MLGRALSHRLALRAALAALALALLAYGLFKPAASRRAAPALPAHTISGRAVTLAQLRGHATAVVFFASWCTPCNKEAPAVERFARSRAGRGRVIAVDYSDGGRWRKFLHDYSWTMPVFSDTNGVHSDAFGVANLPTTVILDARGRIAAAKSGAQTVATLTSELHAAA